MQIMDAIYKRRAVRSFKEAPLNRDILMKLLTAAVQAPSAMNQQPWAFVIIEDKDLLKEYSNRAKRFLLGSLEFPLHEYPESLVDRDFNIFYDAGTLVVICATNNDRQRPRIAVSRLRTSCWRLSTLGSQRAQSVLPDRG